MNLESIFIVDHLVANLQLSSSINHKLVSTFHSRTTSTLMFCICN